MADVGTATFRALAEFAGIRREARETSRDLKSLKRDIQNIDTDISFGADTSKIRPSVTKGVRDAKASVKAKDTDVEFDADTSGMRGSLARGVKTAKAGVKEADVEFGAETSGMRRDVERGVKAAVAGQSAKIPVKEDSTGLRERTRIAVASAQRGLEMKIPIKPDPSGLRKAFGAVGASFDVGEIGSGILMMLKIPAALAAIKLVGPVFASLSAGAVGLVAALGPVVGLLGAIPGLAFTAAFGIGAIFAAFRGVGDALKAIDAQKKQGIAGGAAAEKADLEQMRRREAAARGVVKAQRALADAQNDAAERTESSRRAAVRAAEDLVDAQESQRRSAEALDRAVVRASQSLVDAQRRERKSQEDLNRARRDAVEALQQMRFEQERNSISEERAAIAVERARERVAETQSDPTFSDREKREAALDLRDAEESLLEIQDKRADDAKALEDADKKGVEGADNVVAAREAQADAERAVADAQEELTQTIREGAEQQEKAARDIVRAQQDVADATADSAKVQIDNARAISDAEENLVLALQEASDAARDFDTTGSAAASNVAAAMAALSPAGRAFVTFLSEEVLPRLHEITAVAQAGLFPGVEDGIRRMLTILPEVKTIIGAVATEFGDLARRAGEFAASDFFRAALPTLGASGVGFLHSAGDAGLLFADALTRMAVAAEPLIAFLGDLLERAGQAFDEWIRGAEASGAMTRFFGETADVVERLIGIFGSLISIIGSVLGAAKPLGDDLFGGLADSLERAAEWADSFKGQTALRDFFEAARPVLHETLGLLGDIIKIMGGIFDPRNSGAEGLIAQVRAEIIPALAELFKATSVIAPPLIELAGAFIRFFASFATESGPLVGFIETLTKILNFVTELIDKNDGLKTFVFTILTFAGGIKAFAFVGEIFSGVIAVIAALPLTAGLAIAAIALLAGGFLLAYKNSESFRKVVQRLVDWFKSDVARSISDWADSLQEDLGDLVDWWNEHSEDISEAVGHITTVIMEIWGRFGPLFIGAVKDTFGTIAEVVNASLDIVRGIIEFVLAVINGDWGKAWDALLTVLRGVWDLMFAVVRFGIEGIENLLSLAFDIIAAIWSTGWEIVSGILGAVWDVLAGIVGGGLDIIKNVIETVMGTVASIWAGIWDGIKTGFGAVWEGITDVIRGGVQGIINVLNAMIGGVNAILAVLPGEIKVPTIPDLKAESQNQFPGGQTVRPAAHGVIGGLLAANDGGRVPGEGPDRDSVHAVLTPGEFVVRRRAVKAFGVGRLEQINRMGFNDGGPVRMAAGGLTPRIRVPNVLGGLKDAAGDVLGGIGDIAKSVAEKGAKVIWAGIRAVAEAGINVLPFGNTTIGKIVKGVPLKALDAIGNFINGNDPGPAVVGQAKGLDPDFLAAFKRYSAKDGPFSITSGFRTAAQQAALVKSKPGLAAPVGSSNHQRGLAIDHSPNSTPKERQDAIDFGLWYPMASLIANGPARSGGKYEPWHVEPIKTKGLNRGGRVTVPTFGLGGLVEQDGLVGVHRKEMILDPALSSAVQDMATRGGGDTNVNVIVNNPIGETAENSVSRTVRKLSYLGHI